MRASIVKPIAVYMTAAMALIGCENLSQDETQGAFSTGGAAAASRMARASGMTSAGSLATGSTAGDVSAATVYVIAKHQATVRQRKIAEERARAAMKKIVEREKADAAAEQAARAANKPYTKRTKRRPRYIAVDTEKNEETSPKAKKAVMLFDTESQQIVGNDVYDVESVPPVGQTARFETYSAEYVSGS